VGLLIHSATTSEVLAPGDIVVNLNYLPTSDLPTKDILNLLGMDGERTLTIQRGPRGRALLATMQSLVDGVAQQKDEKSPRNGDGSPFSRDAPSQSTLHSVISALSDDDDLSDSPSLQQRRRGSSGTILLTVFPPDGPLKITVLPLSPNGARTDGLVVAGVAGTTGSGSPSPPRAGKGVRKPPAHEPLFQVGDVITSVSGNAVGTSDFEAALRILTTTSNRAIQIRRRLGEKLAEERQREWREREHAREAREETQRRERDALLEAMGRQREEVTWVVERVMGVAEFCEGVKDENEKLKGELVEMRLLINKKGDQKGNQEGVIGGGGGGGKEKGKGKDGGGEGAKAEEVEVEEEEKEEEKIKWAGKGSSEFVDAYLAGRYNNEAFAPKVVGTRTRSDFESMYPHAYVYGERPGRRDFSGEEIQNRLYGAQGSWSRAMGKAAEIQKGKGAVGWHNVGRALLVNNGGWKTKYGAKKS
jgi:hypothetical protein